MAGLALDFAANGRRSTIACECTRTMAELRQEGDYRAIGWPASFEAWQRAGLSLQHWYKTVGGVCGQAFAKRDLRGGTLG